MPRDWILAHFPLFRLALFGCCAAYWLIGYLWLKPGRRELAIAIMAVWIQFCAGALLDIGIVRFHYWSYRPMPFTLHGVPLDLHLDWALIWGFILVWLYSRLRRHYRGWPFVPAYLTIWTLFTLVFDLIVARRLLFLSAVSQYWWIADATLLFLLQVITLWVYHTAMYRPSIEWRDVWACRIRSVLYVGSLAYVFYGYIPSVILSRTDGWDVRPLAGLGDWRVLAAVAALPLALGTWATVQFTDVGRGTPIPLDPPRRLVATGPYAYVRNPMQISGILVAIVIALYHPTAYMALYLLDVLLISGLLFHIYERKELAEMFGEPYLRYKSHVKNWLPRLDPYK